MSHRVFSRRNTGMTVSDLVDGMLFVLAVFLILVAYSMACSLHGCTDQGDEAPAAAKQHIPQHGH